MACLKWEHMQACTDTEVLLKHSQTWTVDSGYMHLLQTGAWNNFENIQRLASTLRVTAKALFSETLCAESQVRKRWSELLQRCTSSPSDNQCSLHTVGQRGTQRQCRGLAGHVARWNLPIQQPSPARLVKQQDHLLHGQQGGQQTRLWALFRQGQFPEEK